MIFELPRYQCLTADLCLYKAALDLKLTRNSKQEVYYVYSCCGKKSGKSLHCSR